MVNILHWQLLSMTGTKNEVSRKHTASVWDPTQIAQSLRLPTGYRTQEPRNMIGRPEDVKTRTSMPGEKLPLAPSSPKTRGQLSRP